MEKASTFTQSQSLANTEPSNNSRTLPFVIPYNPDLTPLPHILKQHWQYTARSSFITHMAKLTGYGISVTQKNQRTLCTHQIHQLKADISQQHSIP